MKILLIVEPEREDWYHYLKSDNSNEYLLLWHESSKDIPDWLKRDTFFKKVYDWQRFITPVRLLKEIKPDRIVFFEIIDQRQIALLVTANKKKVKTFYLEHGAAGDREAAIMRANEPHFFLNIKKNYLLNRFKNGLGRLIRSKIFYYSANFKVASFGSMIKYARLPFSMLFNTPNKTLANCIFPERTPFRSIVFNQPNFKQFQVYTGISEDSAVFTGVPLFDTYYNKKKIDEGFISYIDHPYLEEGLLGWTAEWHKMLADKLMVFAKSVQKKILVKLHPRSDIGLWKSYNLDPTYLEIVQKGDLTDRLLSSRLILSYSSSLVNGFLCAQKNLVLLGWHPAPGIFGADFSKTGLCHVSLYPDELNSMFSVWVDHNLSLENRPGFEKFLKEFNYPFDGKAGKRVIETITGNEVP